MYIKVHKHERGKFIVLVYIPHKTVIGNLHCTGRQRNTQSCIKQSLNRCSLMSPSRFCSIISQMLSLYIQLYRSSPTNATSNNTLSEQKRYQIKITQALSREFINIFTDR